MIDARNIIKDIKSNLYYFREVTGYYFPSYEERMIDSEYI